MRIRRVHAPGRCDAAISTEFVIVLVLLAVAGILGFMFLGQQLRNHSKNITDKIGGQVVTKTKSTGVDTGELTSDRDGMTGAIDVQGQDVQGAALHSNDIP